MINLNSRGEVGKTKGGGRGNGARLLTSAIAKKLVYEAWFHAVGGAFFLRQAAKPCSHSMC